MTFEYKDILAWWGAILSTILGISALRAKMSRIKFHYRYLWIFNPESSADEPYACVSIVNTGENIIIIKKIVIERFVSEGARYFKNEKIEYSEKLSHGEEFKYRIPISPGYLAIAAFDLTDINDPSKNGEDKMTLSTIQYPSKIRILVSDTTGKEYTSDWIDITDVKKTDDPNIVYW